jgi:hypothetical protein
MEDPVRRPLQLLDSEYSDASRQRTDRLGNGVEEKVALVETNPESQDDSIPYRRPGSCFGDLE